ncbi:MAG: hypothetical protein IT373_25025 [Polyangiaceae bacterium]|nr:hypothetical protein [Polyangiaceae bacterium]
MNKRFSWSIVGAVALLVGGCGGKDWEPGVKAIEELAPFMEKNLADCMMMPKVFGEEANTKSDALMKLPSKYSDDFKAQASALKEKFGARLDGPCGKVVDGAKKCRADGAGNISGHGQSVIDVCKAVKGIEEKLQ